MKIARASQADMAMAFELVDALGGLSAAWGAQMPEKIERKKSAAEEFEWLDFDDGEQCKRIVAYLRDLSRHGSLDRVVWGMAALLDPDNGLLDPNADVLARHPRLVAAEKDAERYRFLRGRDLDTISQGGVFAGLTPTNVVLNGEDLDAQVDAAMLGAANVPDELVPMCVPRSACASEAARSKRKE